MSERLAAWSSLEIADYDLEYRLRREGGGDSGTYRAQVRDGETLGCFVDGERSLRLECDPAYYSVESIFDRIIYGDARTAEVVYDADWHFPALVRHELRSDLGDPYTLEVVTFVPREPIDWVAYVEDAIDWLENSYSGDVDWDEVREEALGRVLANPRRANAYSGLERAANLVRGSLFLTPREVAVRDSQPHDEHSPSGEPPSGERIGNVGYLKLAGALPDQAASYAEAVHDLMADVDVVPVCAWVVDVRGPYFVDPARDLVALGPLLGEGTHLTYVLEGEEHVFSFFDGVAYVNSEPAVEAYRAQGKDVEGLTLPRDAYTLSAPDAPVAVLTSLRSSSWPVAGFDHRPRTMVFGEPAQGGLGIFVSGELPSLDLPLGARLYPPRSGDVVARLVEPFDPRPDRIVLPLPESGVDEVLEDALEWLRQQPSCATRRGEEG